MNRRTVWLGLIVLAAQFSSGCCHFRTCGFGWRWANCGPCAPACAPTSCAPSFASPSCPSCFYGPSPAAPAPVMGAPVMGAPMSFAPGAVGTVVPPTTGPTVEPSRDGTPLPMPKSVGF